MKRIYLRMTNHHPLNYLTQLKISHSHDLFIHVCAHASLSFNVKFFMKYTWDSTFRSVGSLALMFRGYYKRKGRVKERAREGDQCDREVM
jgi:hypothetical protein